MKTYEQMLKEAEKRISREESKEKRLEIPPANVIIQGNKTFITNFMDIVNSIRRDPKYLAKFLFRELAKALLSGEIQYKEKDIYKIKPIFRLHPPKKGHRGTIKKHYNEGGTLGNVGIYINELIHKML